MSGNLLLASYPKSGNTWLRIFLSNLRRDSPEPVDINTLDDATGAAGQNTFDEAIGIEATGLTDEEIEFHRPEVFRYLARVHSEPVFIKIHEAYRLNSSGVPLIPGNSIKGAVYVVRNPFDVAISLAHHLGHSIDRTIDHVLARDYAPRRRFLSGQIRERLLPWGQHVTSWVDQHAFPVHVVRYEDMMQTPLTTFTDVVRFCDLPGDTPRVQRAIAHSSFDVLQRQERERGFREKPSSAQSFFRRGKAGAWRDTLSKFQVERIVGDHGEVMKRFGYWPITE